MGVISTIGAGGPTFADQSLRRGQQAGAQSAGALLDGVRLAGELRRQSLENQALRQELERTRALLPAEMRSAQLGLQGQQLGLERQELAIEADRAALETQEALRPLELERARLQTERTAQALEQDTRQIERHEAGLEVLRRRVRERLGDDLDETDAALIERAGAEALRGIITADQVQTDAETERIGLVGEIERAQSRGSLTEGQAESLLEMTERASAALLPAIRERFRESRAINLERRDRESRRNTFVDQMEPALEASGLMANVSPSTAAAVRSILEEHREAADPDPRATMEALTLALRREAGVGGVSGRGRVEAMTAGVPGLSPDDVLTAINRRASELERTRREAVGLTGEVSEADVFQQAREEVFAVLRSLGAGSMRDPTFGGDQTGQAAGEADRGGGLRTIDQAAEDESIGGFLRQRVPDRAAGQHAQALQNILPEFQTGDLTDLESITSSGAARFRGDERAAAPAASAQRVDESLERLRGLLESGASQESEEFQQALADEAAFIMTGGLISTLDQGRAFFATEPGALSRQARRSATGLQTQRLMNTLALRGVIEGLRRRLETLADGETEDE